MKAEWKRFSDVLPATGTRILVWHPISEILEVESYYMPDAADAYAENYWWTEIPEPPSLTRRKE